MTPECRAVLERYRTSPRALDGHLLARLRVLQDFEDPSRILKRDRLTRALLVAAGILAACGIAEWLLTPSRILLFLGGLALLGAGGTRLAFLRARSNEFLDLAREGQAVLAYVVMANTRLFEAGSTPLPSLTVFSLEEERRFDEEYLAGLAERLWELRDLREPPPYVVGGETMIHDPWSRPYVYRAPAKASDPYTLRSTGPDGIVGTADDVEP